MTATTRSYRQRCPVTRALDLVGDRWTLVIVRDLLDGPRRFGELRRDLAGISPTLLSERLARLASDGIVTLDDGRYRLTDLGRGLQPVIDELGRWGLAAMGGRHADDDAFHEHFRRLGLRFALRPEVLPDRPTTVTVDVDGTRFLLHIAEADHHPRLGIEHIGPEPAIDDAGDEPDASLRAELAAVYAVRRGRADLARLERDGLITLRGPRWLTDALRSAITPR